MFLCGIDAVRSPLQSPNDCLHEVVKYLGKSYIYSSHWQSSLDRLKLAFLESVVDERLILSAIEPFVLSQQSSPTSTTRSSRRTLALLPS